MATRTKVAKKRKRGREEGGDLGSCEEGQSHRRGGRQALRCLDTDLLQVARNSRHYRYPGEVDAWGTGRLAEEWMPTADNKMALRAKGSCPSKSRDTPYLSRFRAATGPVPSRHSG